MCAAHGHDSGYLRSLGIPPAEILDPGRVCPRCKAVAPPADVCHVCGGKGEPESYWKTLCGRELPDEGNDVTLLSMAAREAGADENGRIDEAGLELFFSAAGVTTRGERDHYRQLLRTFLAAEASGRSYALEERTEKAKKAAEKK